MNPTLLLVVCCAVFLSACASYSAAAESKLVIGVPATATGQPLATFTTENPTARPRETKTFTLPAPTATSLPTAPTATSTQAVDTPIVLHTDSLVPGIERAAWMDLPVIPTVSDTMRAVYQRGQQNGNNPHVFAKVGDCSTVTKSFLGAFDFTSPQWYRLGAYTNLEGVIAQFNGSFSRVSVASKLGFGSAAVLSPMNSDPKQCDSKETPIECEFRILKPSLVLIMLGTNDYLEKPSDFEKNMRAIIEFWLGKGVVPILSTKADNMEGDGSINATIARLAGEYELPYGISG